MRPKEIHFKFIEGYFQCDACNTRIEGEDAIYEHVYSKHKENLLIKEQNSWVPVEKFEARHGFIAVKKKHEYECILCGTSGFPKKGNVYRHLGFRVHNHNVKFIIKVENIPAKNRMILIEDKGILSHEKGFKSVTPALQSLFNIVQEIGYDHNEKPKIQGSSIRLVEIRKALRKYNGLICDNSVLYLDGALLLFEYKATHFRDAVNQLVETMMHVLSEGMDLLFSVLITESLRKKNIKEFKRNKNTWVLERKGTKKPLEVQGRKIFVAKDNEKLKSLVNKINQFA